jgi:hypothetical protein
MECEREQSTLVERRAQYHPVADVQERHRKHLARGRQDEDETGLVHDESPAAAIRREGQIKRRDQAVGHELYVQ